MKKVRIAIAQMNPTVGDLPGNVKKINSYIRKAKKLSTDIVVFPELAVTGYPPEDLLLKPHFVQDSIEALHEIKEASNNIITIVGFVDRNNGIYNAAAIISNGRLIDIYHKKILPNYGVFDTNTVILRPVKDTLFIILEELMLVSAYVRTYGMKKDLLRSMHYPEQK